jgi:hypothetical protein
VQEPIKRGLPDRSDLEVVFSRGQPYEQRVRWPIARSTAKAWFVQTPGGDIWLPSYGWDHMPLKAGTTPDEQKLNSVLSYLADVTSTCNDARVEVRRAGKGSSDLSLKVAYAVAILGDNLRVIGERNRTAIVPVSQLAVEGDKCWLPRWVLSKKLCSNERLLKPASWQGLHAVEEQLKASLEAASAGRAEAQARQSAAIAAWREQQAEKATRQAAAKVLQQSLVAEDGELALAFARQKLTLSEIRALGCSMFSWPRWVSGEAIDAALERTLANVVRAVRKHPDFPAWRTKNLARKGSLLKPAKPPRPRLPDSVLEHCSVQWSEWVGPTRSQSRVDYSEGNCRVAVFGKKYEIELPDGRIIVKMAGPNLKVTKPAAPEVLT